MRKITSLMKLLPLCSLLWLSACASSDGQPINKVAKLTLKVEASEVVNQDRQQRSSPVLLRIYELKNPAAFEQLDYFSLQDKDRALLGDDLISKGEYIIKPEEQRIIIKTLSADTEAIGFVAGFQNLSEASWRKVYRLNRKESLGAMPRWMQMNQKVKLAVDLFGHNLVLFDEEMNQF